ncbi:ATP-dependent DNA helicase RecG [bacterium]|nr:ATP-dependent DNA helicase RecG [bacterium]
MLSLNDPLCQIKGIGPKKAAQLKKLGIRNVKDLLLIFPKKYLNLKALKPIGQIKLSEKKQLISGKITNLNLFRTPKRRFFILEGIIQDKSGSLLFRFFNQPYLYSVLKNKEVFFFGKTKLDRGKIVFENPLYEFKTQTQSFKKMFPLYPEVAGFSSKQIRQLIKNTLVNIKRFPAVLPRNLNQKFNLYSLEYALKIIHQPLNIEALKKAKKTWAVLEMLAFIAQTKTLKKQKKKWQSFSLKPYDLNPFTKNLPFKLTSDQTKALQATLNDTSQKHPSASLLNGDVGSGKTIVAFLAMINTALNKKQAVLMAPTEILAYQHFLNFNKFFKSRFKTVLLTNIWRLKSKKAKTEKLKNLAEIKKANLIFGTHALLEEKIKIPNLALAIIDEQQRFGVKQRAKLRQKINKKNFLPHLLMLTATPIPRTLTLILFEDLKVNFLKTTPFRRQTLTKVLGPNQNKQAYQKIHSELKKGNQAFVVCPIIEKKETLDFDNRKAAEEEFKKIKKIFPKFQVDLLHGRMKPKEKEKTIREFKKGKTQILVATSVIEVGVDIAKATVLLVETAEHFGFSQLHQLRGRIGRSGQKSYCFFIASSQRGTKKIKFLEKTTDGFKIAEQDLKHRGPGEILGEQQHGFLKFRFANIFSKKLSEKIKKITKELKPADWQKLLLLK